MKKLITKIKHKLIHWLGGEIPVTIKKPLIISKTVPLSVIKAAQRIPAKYHHQLVMVTPNNALNREIENALAMTIGKEIIKHCGFYKSFDNTTNEHVFEVIVEITERSLLEKKYTEDKKCYSVIKKN